MHIDRSLDRRRLNMNQLKLMPPVLLAICMAGDLWAVSMVETQREEGSDRMYIDGHRLLVKDPAGEGSMIIDIKNLKSYAVNQKNKTAVDMSETIFAAIQDGGARQLPKVDAKLEKIGDGPEIAGYATTHYVLYADGQKCSDLWTSREALKDAGWDVLWSEFGDSMKALAAQDDAHPCDLADMQAFQPEKHGMPLKEIDRNCETDLVLRIENNVDFDRNAFEVPADYKVISLPAMPGATGMSEPSDWGPWQGQDCSGERNTYPTSGDMEDYFDEEGMYEEDMDEEYMEDEYSGEYDEEESDDNYVDEIVDDTAEEEHQDLDDTVKNKFKGFMDKIKKTDNNG